MIIASFAIILWQFQKYLKFSIFNAKALATILTLFSIVCAFATRFLPILCSKRVASAFRFGKIQINQEISYKIYYMSTKPRFKYGWQPRIQFQQNFRFNLYFKIIDNLEIILWEFQKVP